MKIVDVPQTGKLGLTVTYPGRNGLIRRTKVTPANPRTSAQTAVRSDLASQASAYRQMTDAQILAWRAAAAKIKSTPTLGQSGPLTGLQLFTKINCALLAIGQPAVIAPPPAPVLIAPPVDGLQVTNTAGTIAVKLHTTGAPEANTMLLGAAPVSAGVFRCPQCKLLGTLGAPAADGYVDITSAYTASFGAPAVGQRVFVQVKSNTNGWEGRPVTFSARVPAGA